MGKGKERLSLQSVKEVMKEKGNERGKKGKGKENGKRKGKTIPSICEN